MIQFKFKKRDVEPAIQVVLNAVGGGDDGEIATHFLFRYREERVTIASYDKRRLLSEAPVVGAQVEGIQADEEAAFTTPAWRLRKWLSAVNDAEEMLTLTLDAGVVKASSVRSKGKLGSIDPKNWPYWDQTFKEAKETTKIGADHLMNILSYTKCFISDQETRSAPLVATECRDGILSATDGVGMVRVVSEALKDSTLRIHGKDIPTILSFLSLAGTEEVKLLEHSRCLFIVRKDGSMLGVSRWVHELPNLKVGDGQYPDIWFTVRVAELQEALRFLEAFAKKDDSHIHLRFDGGNMYLSMESGSGSAEADEHPVPCVDHEGMDLVAAAGYKEFILTKKLVEVVSTTFGEDTLRFRVVVTPKNGYVSTEHQRDGDAYSTVIVWIRPR